MAIHPVGSLRRFCDTLAPDSAVAACRLSYLGNLYGAASLAMPSDGARELARRQGRSRALPRRVPASSSR